MLFCAKKCWLPFLSDECAPTFSPVETAGEELAKMGISAALQVNAEMGDGYAIEKDGEEYVIRGGERGILYGAYQLLEKTYLGQDACCGETQPVHPLRMLNHWDNMNGDIERGYAGKSFFFKDSAFCWDEKRIRFYGRMLASAGINAVTLNNVNVHYPADRLCTEELLPELKKIADVLRAYGVRLIISVDYALPVTLGLETADPLDERVQAFWNKQVDLIYSYIPDLCGFLVKADSEFRPGPYMYKRNHAEGANLLARALKPHDGVLIWRCFVYNCRQNWRDHSIDRPMAAYENYAYLDGRFEDNVILQIKNGPYDFQVREPVSPLLFAMPKTCKAIEYQLAQEYTGQQIDLYYMAEVWDEVLSVMKEMPAHIAAVTNLGNDENWTGHTLAQANLYAYGRLAWMGRGFDGKQVLKDWIALTFGPDFTEKDRLEKMMLSSRGIYEKYTANLGLGWMVTPHSHYGPDAEGYEYDLWGTYHRANREAVGIDRSDKGTGYAMQYPDDLAKLYNDPATCPEKMLLFFHRMRYDHVMQDGRTLLQRLYDDHFEGLEGAEWLLENWQAMKDALPEAEYQYGLDRFERQLKNAQNWCDRMNTYFYRFTLVPDQNGRTIYD